MTLLTLYVPCDSSFISTQFLLLNLDDWFVVSSNKLIIFWYSFIISYCYINLRSLIIFCPCSRDIYLFLSISLPCSIFSSELFRGENFGTVVILSVVLFPIKSPVAPAVFWIALFEAILSASDCSRLLRWSRSFWRYFLRRFLLIFLPLFLGKDKNP